MSQVITIVGSSARAAAFSAVRAGYCVHAADQFVDLDLRRVATAIQAPDYPQGLATAVRGPQSGGWMYCGALENYPALVEQLASVRPLWGNSGDGLRRVRQPQLLSKTLRHAGLPSPKVSFEVEVIPRDGSWMRKPLRSAGGMHIAIWQGQQDMDPSEDSTYFQERIDGAACAAVYVGARGRAVLLGVTRQMIGAAWTGADAFRYCGSIGPLPLTESVSQQFAVIGNTLASEFDLVGLFGVDAIVNAQGVWPVEVNPRYTASVEILEWAYGMHAVEMHVAACSSGQLPASHKQMSAKIAGKAILFATEQLSLPAGFSVSMESRDARPEVADIPPEGTTIERHWPILTVLAEGLDESAVLAALRTRAAEISIALHR